MAGDEESARGFSLWLMPEGELKARLAERIVWLARRHGTPSFAPHLTLLAGLETAEADVRREAAALAGELAPFEVRLSALDARDEYFRCLFVRAERSAALEDAHARAARRFGRLPDPAFLPHLSLIYGRLPGPAKRRLRAELAREVEGRFGVGRVHLWRTQGPVSEWRARGDFALGPGRG